METRHTVNVRPQTMKAKSLSPRLRTKSATHARNNNMAAPDGIHAGLAEVSRMLLHPDYSPLASTGRNPALQRTSFSDRDEHDDSMLSQSLNVTSSEQRRRVLSDKTPGDVLVRKREHASHDSIPCKLFRSPQRTSGRNSYTNDAFHDSSDLDDVIDAAAAEPRRRSRIHNVVDFLKPSRLVRLRPHRKHHTHKTSPLNSLPFSSEQSYYGFYSAPVSRASTPVSDVT